MAWWKTLRGGRGWFGKSEAKAAGKRARRQEDKRMTEIERRELAYEHRGEVVEGSGVPVEPRDFR